MSERLVNLNQTQKDCIRHLTSPDNPRKLCLGCPNDRLTPPQECQVRYTRGVHNKVGAPYKSPRGVDKPAPKVYIVHCPRCGCDFTASSLASRHVDCPASFEPADDIDELLRGM